MEDLKNFVTSQRAEEIISDIESWHKKYIEENQIETDELKQKIFDIKMKDILYNLKNNPNLTGNLSIKQPHEMNPKRWEEMMQLYDAQKNKIDQVIETDMFQCSRCNSKKCTYFTLQTRSADESETQFITCLNCSKRWKQ